MLEDILKALNPTSPDLMYNKTYHLWKEGKYLGAAIWKRDENIGDSFQTQFKWDGQLVNKIWLPDQWKLVED